MKSKFSGQAFGGKSGQGHLRLLLVIIVMGVIMVSAVKAFSSISANPMSGMGKVACPVFCRQRDKVQEPPDNWMDWLTHPKKAAGNYVEHFLDPRKNLKPSSMGCYCSITEREGNLMHIAWDMHGGHPPEELWEFHLTDQMPSVHRHSSVKGNFNHKDSCELNTTPIVNNNTGCWIYTVDKTGDEDGCRLYNVSVGSVLNGTLGQTIREDLENEGKVFTSAGWGYDNDDFASPIEISVYKPFDLGVFSWNDLDNDEKLVFGKSRTTGFKVYTKNNVHPSQRYLMAHPTQNNFTLWKHLICTSKKREITVPPDKCSQECKKDCENKGDKIMYMNSECAENEPGKEYNLATDGNPSCDTSEGETCWCACTTTEKYYWKVIKK